MTRVLLFLLADLAIQKESESYRVDPGALAHATTTARFACQNDRCTVSGLKGQDLLAQLGLQNGDVVIAPDASDPQKLLEGARFVARSAVHLERRGQPLTLNWILVIKPLSAEDLSRLVKPVDERHFVLDRQIWKRVLSDHATLPTQTRIVPAIKDGHPRGFKLYAIRPDSVFARLGLENGDTLLGVNGQDLSSLEAALDVYSKLRDAKELVVKLERKGNPLTIHYEVR